MAVICTPQSLATAAGCIDLLLSTGVREQVKSYLLAVLAGGSTNAQTLYAQAQAAGWCSQGVTPEEYDAIQAYLIATKLGLTLQDVATASVCFYSVEYSLKQASILYLLAGMVGADVSAATMQADLCIGKFDALTTTEAKALNAYLVSLIVVNANSLASIYSASKCWQMLESGDLLNMTVYLWCQYANGGSHSASILLESGGFILLESGGQILLE